MFFQRSPWCNFSSREPVSFKLCCNLSNIKFACAEKVDRQKFNLFIVPYQDTASTYNKHHNSPKTSD
jgi:hypothetical protein